MVRELMCHTCQLVQEDTHQALLRLNRRMVLPTTDVAMHHLHLLKTKIKLQEVDLVVLQQYEVPNMLVCHWLQGKLHYLEFEVEVEAYPSKRLNLGHCSLVDPCHTLDIDEVEDDHHT